MNTVIPVTKRQAMSDFFRNRLGEKFSASKLREKFGMGYRDFARDINLDPDSMITIVNEVKLTRYGSSSQWWAEERR